jgi:exodeoxyribonuclease V
METNTEQPKPQPLPPPTPVPINLSAITLTPEQEEGVTKIVDWLGASDSVDLLAVNQSKDEFKLGGYAGTGKTTIIRTILYELAKQFNIEVCAFTGKACHVLQKKGIPSRTLHSLMYDVSEDPNSHETIFTKKDKLESLPDLIIVDEASMVSSDLYRDLKSFNIHCLFVGDPGQLEPVGDNPNLMKEPDYVLSKIHRQAEGNPIISLAQTIRIGGPLARRPDDGRCYVDYKANNLNTPWLRQADQVICAKNKTRTQLNTNFRKLHGFVDKGLLVEGEKLICLRNNMSWGVFNGMIFTVKQILDTEPGWTWKCLVEDEVGRQLTIPIWQQPFRNPEEKVERVPKKVVYCDYGYVITCHKSQGSEWKHVHVIDEWMPPAVWSMQRWRYTAITRAAERLVYSF